MALVAREPQFNRSHVHGRIVGGLRVLLLGGLRGAHLATATGSVVGVSIENLNPTEEVLGGLLHNSKKRDAERSKAIPEEENVSLSLARARASKKQGFPRACVVVGRLDECGRWLFPVRRRRRRFFGALERPNTFWVM